MKKPTNHSKVIIAPNPPKPKQEEAAPEANTPVACPCETPAQPPKTQTEVQPEEEAEE